jgi:hypothetical protein
VGVRSVVFGATTPHATQINVRDVPDAAPLQIYSKDTNGTLTVHLSKSKLQGRRGRRQFDYEKVLAEQGQDAADIYLDGAYGHLNAGEIGESARYAEKVLATVRTQGTPAQKADLAAHAPFFKDLGKSGQVFIKPDPSAAPGSAIYSQGVKDAVARLMVVSDSGRSRYYEALNVQHFGPSPTASNLTELKDASEALSECIRQRGGQGCDREKLLAMGTDPEAILSYDQARYWVFNAKGRLGLIGVGEVTGEAIVELRREKPGSHLSLVLTGRDISGSRVVAPRPKTDVATAIIGMESGKEELWTIHPGLPAPSGAAAGFEAAGYKDGDLFRLGDLVDARSSGGAAVRNKFHEHEVTWKDIAKIKVALSAAAALLV